MIDSHLQGLLNRYRMYGFNEDGVSEGMPEGMKVNRLFGLDRLIRENLIGKEHVYVCELGSHIGASSALFAYYCSLVVCVDIFPDISFSRMFDDNMREFNNVIKIKSSTENAYPMFSDGLFDFIYIDASHEYQDVMNDITHWLPKIKPGALIGGHDYTPWTGVGVVKAVDEVFGKPDVVYEDSSWIKKL